MSDRDSLDGHQNGSNDHYSHHQHHDDGPNGRDSREPSGSPTGHDQQEMRGRSGTPPPRDSSRRRRNYSRERDGVTSGAGGEPSSGGGNPSSSSGKRARGSPARDSSSPMSARRRHTGDREQPPPGRCLGVFGLSIYTQERDLKEVLGKYGRIEDIQIVYDAQTGRSRGFAFVYFERETDAADAKEACNGIDIDGRKIRVDFSVTQRAHTPTPGIYMGKPTRSRVGGPGGRGSYNRPPDRYEERGRYGGSSSGGGHHERSSGYGGRGRSRDRDEPRGDRYAAGGSSGGGGGYGRSSRDDYYGGSSSSRGAYEAPVHRSYGDSRAPPDYPPRGSSGYGSSSSAYVSGSRGGDPYGSSSSRRRTPSPPYYSSSSSSVPRHHHSGAASYGAAPEYRHRSRSPYSPVRRSYY